MINDLDKVLCPCCSLPTLSESAAFEICSVCGWEDDGQNDSNSEKVLGGPNKDYSLDEARGNFAKFQTMYREEDELFPTNNKYIEIRDILIKKYEEYASKVVNINLTGEIRNIESRLLITPRNKGKIP